jgi:imidazole glycerol-phosphate synthase subunit HisH
MQIAVVDYGMGNIRSVSKALERVAPRAQVAVTADPARIRAADRVVVPGQGAMPDCMRQLAASGARDAVIDSTRAKPFLGICIGMQMLFESSEESPGVTGLGIVPGTVRLLAGDVKRPQMQWNLLERRGDPELLHLVPDPAWAYFVHSYAAETDDALVIATCDYGGPVVAAVEQGSVWATQFHPEKSSRTGLAVLQAFVERASARVAV